MKCFVSSPTVSKFRFISFVLYVWIGFTWIISSVGLLICGVVGVLGMIGVVGVVGVIIPLFCAEECHVSIILLFV